MIVVLMVVLAQSVCRLIDCMSVSLMFVLVEYVCCSFECVLVV